MDDFQDPLRGYQATKHPSPSLSESLSSAPSSPVAPDGLLQQLLKPEVEKILGGYMSEDEDDDTVRLLGAFLKYLCEDAQITLMQEIKEFGDQPAKLRQLRDFLVDSILKPMKMAGGKQPKSLTPTPFKGAFRDIGFAMTTMEPSSRIEQSALKAQCLKRDSHCCVVSGMVDVNYFHSLSPQSRRNLKSCRTKCAHIIPFALRKFDPKSARETEIKAQIWWALYRYFPFINGKIGPESINTAANAVTLRSDAYTEFGALLIAAEPMDTVNNYRILDLGAVFSVGRDLPPTVTFSQSDPEVDMPDPDFLRLHYQVSMILDVSGIGEKIDRIMWENEKPGVIIQPDGSTDLGRIISCKLLMDI